MKKRVLSVLLLSAILVITGCNVAENKPVATAAATTPVVTTTVATTTAATTTTSGRDYGAEYREQLKKENEESDKFLEELFAISGFGTSTATSATTKPSTTTTAKPVEPAKPDDTDNTKSGLGSFTGEPEIDWGGKQLSLEIERVSGATEYHLSIDSKGFTDNGDLYSKTRSLPTKEKSTIDLDTSYDFALPRYVYIRITATNSKESTVKEIKYDTYRGSAYGDAGHIDGRTVIVSIFADDPTTKWTNSSADKQMMEETWESLRCATEWLTKSAAKYGANAEFIWDWKKDSELKYMSSFDTELDIDMLDRSYEFTDGDESQRSAAYMALDSLLRENINDIENERYMEYILDTKNATLTSKYDADNIIYLYIVNTTSENGTNSFAVDEKNNNQTEYIVVYVREHKNISRANTYAHEILHLFGTPDLYCENDTITQAYADHLAANGCNSIMYYSQSKDKITREFTDLEAYYTGLIDYHEDVKKWGLGESKFFKGQ